MWALLLGLVAHAQEPFDPLDPFAGARPTPAAPEDNTAADPVLDELETDVQRWSLQAGASREALRVELGRWMSGRGTAATVSERATNLGVVLQVLAARERLARARLLELGLKLGMERGERLRVASVAVGDVVRESLEPLVAARLRLVDAHLKAGDTEGAMTEAEALVARLDELQRVSGPEPRIDEARLTLMRVATATGHPARTEAWARSCRDWCTPDGKQAGRELAEIAESRVAGQTGEGVDPLADLGDGGPVTGDGPAPAPPEVVRPIRHRAWAAVGVVPPLGAGRFEGAEVRRGLSGAVDVGWAPSDLACVTLRGAVDAWSVPQHPGDIDVRRGRAELGYCPWLGSWNTQHLTVGLRPVAGVGLSVGRAVEAGDDQRQVGVGLHVRLEAPVVVGSFVIVPSLGASPYGRATAWDLGTSRTRYTFVDRVYGTISVGVGLR